MPRLFPSHHLDTLGDIERTTDPRSHWTTLDYRTQYTILVTADVDQDWTFYSKAYHRKYGPRTTTSNRRVEFYTPGPDGELVLRKTYRCHNFAGLYLTQAVSETLRLPSKRERGWRRRVQLRDVYRIEPVEPRSTTLFRRTLAGQTYDYCAVRGLQTFHASTIDAAKTGLAKKLYRQQEIENDRASGTLINRELGLKLGFCEQGMKEFCDTLGFDYDKEYTADEVAQAINVFRVTGGTDYMSFVDAFDLEWTQLLKHINRTDLYLHEYA